MRITIILRCAALAVLIILQLLYAPTVRGQCGSVCTGYNPASWPASWVTYTFATGYGIQDPSDESPSYSDVIYSTGADTASVLAAFDGTNAFFRIMVAADPTSAQGGYQSTDWLAMISDSAGTHLATVGLMGKSASDDYVYVIDPNGGNEVIVYRNSTNPSGMRATQVGATSYYYLDIQIPLCVITYVSCIYGQTLFPQQPGITSTTPIRFYYGSSQNQNNINKDYSACTGVSCAVDFSLMTMATFEDIGNGHLPVELGMFTAAKRGNSVHMHWETITESNNYGFEIERRVPCISDFWETRGFVQGQGNANTVHRYTFRDVVHEMQFSTVLQYRLRQIDRDGSSSFSPVLNVLMNPVELPSISNYPNPFGPASGSGSSVTTIRYSIEKDGDIRLDVFDSLNRNIATLVDGFRLRGEHAVAFDAGGLPPGMYQYRIGTNVDVQHTGSMLLY